MLTIIIMLGSVWPFGHRAQTETSRYLIPAWHVDATRDRFTNKMVCRVYQGQRLHPDVTYERETLAFRFSRHLSTLQAEFRVDGGPAQPWTATYPTLIGSGATLTGNSMTNPTDGLVVLPAALLANATTVTIRPTPSKRPRTFGVGGFGDALASARRLGCDPSYGFVRQSR